MKKEREKVRKKERKIISSYLLCICSQSVVCLQINFWILWDFFGFCFAAAATFWRLGSSILFPLLFTFSFPFFYFFFLFRCSVCFALTFQTEKSLSFILLLCFLKVYTFLGHFRSFDSFDIFDSPSVGLFVG